MRRALPSVFSLTKPLTRNPAKQHLHPRRNRYNPTHHRVHPHQHDIPNLPQKPFLDMHPQIHPQNYLSNEQEHQPIRKLRVSIGSELSSFVQMANEVSHRGERGAEDLSRDVEAGFYQAENHACGKDDAPCEGLEEDVDPEDGVERFVGGYHAFRDMFVAAVGEGEGREKEEEGGGGHEGGSSAEGSHDGGGGR